MDYYLVSKFLHVAFAITWLGGGLIMVILGTAADRAKDDTDLVWIVRKVAWAAERIYVPASILTLIFGLSTTWFGGLWSHLWVLLGLAGIASTIFLGVVVLTPRAKKVESIFAASGVTPEAARISREILTIAKFDMVVLYVVVADMVLKPQLSDWLTLAIFALVIVAAGFVFIGRLRAPAAAAPA
jgi:hypothetical protein